MLTVPFKSVLDGVLVRAGIIPANASTADILAVIEYIADRFKTGQEYYRWPVYTLVEERFFRPAWDAGATYAEDDEVYYEPLDAYYVALAATSAAESPESEPAKWEALGNFRHQVDYEQDGETPIAAVIGAYDADPDSEPDALPLPFKLRSEGVCLAPDLNLTSVWLEYRPRASDFAAVLWNSTDAFPAGTVLYYPATGEVYRVVSTTTADDNPVDEPEKFAIVPFPEFLARAIKAGALTDWFRGGEKELSAKMDLMREENFTDLLDEQVWQITKLQGQTGRPNVAPKS